LHANRRRNSINAADCKIAFSWPPGAGSESIPLRGGGASAPQKTHDEARSGDDLATLGRPRPLPPRP
jgi:hypothetical protein